MRHFLAVRIIAINVIAMVDNGLTCQCENKQWSVVRTVYPTGFTMHSASNRLLVPALKVGKFE